MQKNATYDGLLNGANDLFKTTCMNNKSYIWVDFQNPKISDHIKMHFYIQTGILIK